MKNFTWPLLLLMFVYGCALIKRTTQTDRESSAQGRQLTTMRDSLSVFSLRDGTMLSSNNNAESWTYAIKLWPKNAMQIPFTNGAFVKYDSVMINVGRANNTYKLNKSSFGRIDVKTENGNYLSVKDTISNNRIFEKTSKFDAKWQFFAVGILLIVLYVTYQYVIKR